MKFIRKSVVVDAVQVTGSNRDEMSTFVRGWIFGGSDGSIMFLSPGEVEALEALCDDWVVRLPDGKLTVCGADEFEKEYCPVGVPESIESMISEAIGHHDISEGGIEGGYTCFPFPCIPGVPAYTATRATEDAFATELSACIRKHGVDAPEKCDWFIQVPRPPDENYIPRGDLSGIHCTPGYVAWKLKDKHQQQEN